MTEVNERGFHPFAYVICVLLAVAATWLFHEFAHWVVGEMLGNHMVMTLNTSYPLLRKYEQPWHESLISAAGPLITLLQAFIFYYLIKKNSGRLMFPFLITCLYMRTLAGIMNLIHLNDEGRISKALGLGPFVLPILMVGILFYLVYEVVQDKKFKGKFITITVLLIMVFSSVLILSDQMFGIKLIPG